MATITIPAVATQYEIRCDSLICRNNLDIPETDQLTKYTADLDRMAEPQNAQGVKVGERTRLPTMRIDMAALFTETYTVDDITVTGLQLLKLLNQAIDAHKAEGL